MCSPPKPPSSPLLFSSFVPMNYVSPLRRPSRRQRFSHTSLTSTDRSFVEFIRCLSKAKGLVHELQLFNQLVCPVLDPSIPFQIELSSRSHLIQHIQSYLTTTFTRFTQLCKALLVILSKIEANHPVRKERIDSFRQDIHDQWQTATRIKSSLLLYI
ncbi:hypothetical protein CLU79DRAFT_768754 [Phycomyces nitens]|nr:hypothetical protein CLU79DRAFT_768754 [Phycomyces nitens]